MDRDAAVVRINDAIGFRASGHSLESKIITRLQEAQRDLEKGKTLPRFLLVEDAELELLTGEHAIDLPDDFIRLDDDNLPHYTDVDSLLPRYLDYMRSYSDAAQRLITLQRPGEPAHTALAPSVFVIRKSTIDFITEADRDYTLVWNYYAADDTLETNIENLWLSEAADWLIGEAGERIAADLRDTDGVALFAQMKQRGRSAVFGDMLADEDAGGPIAMGSKW